MHIHLNFVNTDAVSAARAENLLPNVRQMHSDSGECRLPVPPEFLFPLCSCQQIVWDSSIMKLFNFSMFSFSLLHKHTGFNSLWLVTRRRWG